MFGKFPFALFAVAFTGTLVITAPATLLSPATSALSAGRLDLANCHGSVWQGGATPLLRLRDGTALALPGMHWNIPLGTLMTGTLKADIHWDATPRAEPMELSIRGKQLEIRNMLVPLPVQVIAETSAFLKPAQFSGSLKIQSDRLSVSGQDLEGSATIHWTDAGSALSSINPLGNYQINLVSDVKGLAIALSTTSGVLQLDGQGNWSASQGLQFHGKARAADDQQEPLAELLQHLGPEVSPGVHTISVMDPASK